MERIQSNIEHFSQNDSFDIQKSKVGQLFEGEKRDDLKHLLSDENAPKESVLMALHMLEERTNPIERSKLLTLAIGHPDPEISKVAQGLSDKPVSLAQNTPANAIASMQTLPVITDEIEGVALSHEESLPVLAQMHLGTGDVLEAPTRLDADIVSTQTKVDYKNAAKYWEERVKKEQNNIFENAMGASGEKDKVDPQASRLLLEKLKGIGISVEDLYTQPETSLIRINTAPTISAEEKTRLRLIVKEIRSNTENTSRIQTYTTLRHLATLKDESYYRAYLEVLSDPDLGTEERLEKQRSIVSKAIAAEQEEGGSSLATYIARRGSALRKEQENTKDSAASSPLISDPTKSAIVAGVIAAAGVGNVPLASEAADVSEQMIKQTASQMSTSLQVALRLVESVEATDDGRYSMHIAGYPMIIGLQGSDRLIASIVSEDGKEFPIKQLTISGMKMAMLEATQYNVGKQLFSNTRYSDKAILESVYGIRLDENMTSEHAMDMFRESLASMSPFRKDIVDMYRTFGVVKSNGEIDRSAGKNLSNLLAYLRARIGLRYISTDDLIRIADAWKMQTSKGKPLSMLTPNQAKRILEA